MSIPSKDGSEDLGYSYKYKGKKCCKISLTSDTNGIVRLATVEPGNMHDARILRESIDSIIPTAPIQCLADSGYIGIGLYKHCVDCNIELILSFLSFLSFRSFARKLAARGSLPGSSLLRGSLLRGSLLEAHCSAKKEKE